ESLAHLPQLAPARRGNKRQFVWLRFALRAQLRARSGNGKPLVIEQFLDAEHVFHVQSPVHSLPGAAFGRLQLRKFRLPEAEDIAGQAAKAADFADAEV